MGGKERRRKGVSEPPAPPPFSSAGEEGAARRQTREEEEEGRAGPAAAVVKAAFLCRLPVLVSLEGGWGRDTGRRQTDRQTDVHRCCSAEPRRMEGVVLRLGVRDG